MRATLNRNSSTAAGFGRKRAGWTVGRVASVLAGGVIALCSLGLITAGGYLLTAATSNSGWLALGHGSYATPSEPWTRCASASPPAAPPPRCLWAWPGRPRWSAT
jgi:hypothetical protein